MIKNFVLDATVLLYDPNAMFNFKDNNIIIPITVIEEIDKFKREITELGRNARMVSRHLDNLRENQHKLSDGVPLNDGGVLRVDIIRQLSPKLLGDFDNNPNDKKILSVALELQEQHNHVPVVLVSKNTNLRIKADALGLVAEDYERDKIDINEFYTGVVTIEADDEEIKNFRYKGFYPLTQDAVPHLALYSHIGVILKSRVNPDLTTLGRYIPARGGVVPLKPLADGIWGIKPRNIEQTFALDLLLDEDIKLVTLTGISGTGKTLLALAVGLSKTTDDGRYQRLLVARPVFPLGKDIGYLPGDVEQKLSPWMQPIFDNVQLLLGSSQDKLKQKKRSFSDLMKLGMIEIEPLTYIRGRSLPNQYLIVDEAQNLSPHEIKTIITRAGEGTKVVLTGDPYQIDNPYLDSSSNGLSYVVERFKTVDIAGHVHLTKGERSNLAELAASIL